MRRWISAVILGCVATMLATVTGVGAGAEMPPHADAPPDASDLTYHGRVTSVSMVPVVGVEGSARLALGGAGHVYEAVADVFPGRVS